MNVPSLEMPTSGAPLISAARDLLGVFEQVYVHPELLPGRAWFLLEVARMLARESVRLTTLPAEPAEGVAP